MTEEEKNSYVPDAKFGKFNELGWAGPIEFSELATYFYARPNHAGGRVWFSTSEINLANYQDLVHAAAARREKITIITGAHGVPGSDSLKIERNLYLAERFHWRERFPSYNVRVENIELIKGDYPRMHYLVNQKGITICAWCVSENSKIVRHAIRHAYTGAIAW